MLYPDKISKIRQRLFRTRFVLFLAGLGSCLAFTSCSPEHYKADADKEVQNIIDSKWKAEHGSRANSRISDVERDPNDLFFDPNYIPSGKLSLAEAVALATARNRDYQRQKESLYLSALDLTLFRHNFATKWFGTFDSTYSRNEADESMAI
jgi:hypothetical protein